jgi:digeranylgeranylglycerophospholipid reductase
MEKYDVVIIGAGPAGSVLARLLAEAGKDVLLVEKDEFSGKTSACGGLFDMPYFKKYVTDPAVMEQKITRNVFIMPWGEVVYECDQVTVKRRVFDRHLAENAKKAGAKLITKTKALSYRVKETGRVEVELNDLIKKEKRTVECKVVALADGPHTLAKNNPLFDYTKNKPYWAYAYAYEVEGVPFAENEIKIYLDHKLFPWGYGWIFPNKNESNIGVGTVNKEIDKGIKVKDVFFDFIESYKLTAPLLKNRKFVDKKGGFIPMWLIDHFSDDSQVVLGDAAGMVSPLFGAGIDYSMDAAEASCKVILEAFEKSDFSASHLKKYDEIIEAGFIKDLRKQMLLAKIIINSLKFGVTFPVKILAVFAFGAKYTRWNKIKILLSPLLGKPQTNQNVEMLSHK